MSRCVCGNEYYGISEISIVCPKCNKIAYELSVEKEGFIEEIKSKNFFIKELKSDKVKLQQWNSDLRQKIAIIDDNKPTLRQLAALMAMQGMLASENSEVFYKTDCLVERSLEVAGELIKKERGQHE